MERELAIYVSASPEMDSECELLGQLLADMPKSIGWVIKRTPGRHESGNPDIYMLRRSQFYLILLCMDIMAPIGVELRAAQEANPIIFAYRDTNTTPSPAAAFFIHNSGINWQHYQTPQGFIRKFEQDIITQLIEGTPGYGLEIADIAELSARFEALREEEEKTEEIEGRRGAGRGGVILPSN